ncbi:MAG: Trm112 family protein [Anaerolineae bacterium]|nr:Trm112 family protein [Anaerolineae bacterium]
MEEKPPISPELLEILRCPVAVHSEGEDPGRLELVKGCWLVSHESGNKYPIRDGIPVMLVEVGEKYQMLDIEDLPVPPPDTD